MFRRAPYIAWIAALALGTSSPGLAALPERAHRVVDYAISVQLDADRKELMGTQRLIWTNPSTDTVPDLWFHLYLNAFRDNRSTFFLESGGKLRRDVAPVDGWGWIDVTGMKLANGTDLLPALEFEQPDDGNVHDRTVARVPLPAPVAPGESVTLDIAFTARLPKVYARAGYLRDFYSITQWFPKLGVYEPAGRRGRTAGGWNCHQFHANTEFYADYGNYRVEMTVPNRFVVGATGARIDRRDNADGTTTYVHAQSDVHDFAWTADPRFEEIVDRFDAATEVTEEELQAASALLGRTPDELRLRDVEIRLLLQPEHRRQAKRHLDAAKIAIEAFGLWYGAYPYPTLTIVDPPADAGGASGVEYPTLIFAGTSYALGFWPLSGVREAEIVTVHEFAHQYWYGLVGSNEFEEAWLDEGFTTYSTAKAMDLGYGTTASMVDFLGVEVSGVEADRAQNSLERRYDRIATPAWQFSRSQYGFNAYARPALVLHTLEGMLGRAAFARVLRTYHERFRYGHPRGEDFFAVAEEVSGRDLRTFFDAVVRSTGVFDPAVVRISSEPMVAFRGRLEGDGAAEIETEAAAREAERKASLAGSRAWHSEIELRQLGEVALPVEIELEFEGGVLETRIWNGERLWDRWTFDRPERLLAARIDPQGKIALDANRLNNARRTFEDDAASRKLGTTLLFWVQSALGWIGL